MAMASAQPSWHASSCLEKVLEHRFVAGLTSALWLGGIRDFEVLRSDVDSHGYDLVVEVGGILRHIQLKAMVEGGKRRQVNVNLRLAGKPSGCIIWFNYNPQTLALGPFRWFGGPPGEPLPDVGPRLVKHTKGNSDGIKNVRDGHRALALNSFWAVACIDELVDLLFGASPVTDDLVVSGARAIELLRREIASGAIPERPHWLRAVSDGDFHKIPGNLCWDNSVEFAHLIQGYDLAERLGFDDPFNFAERQLNTAMANGQWSGDAAGLWISLFLEHRRWRMSPIAPDPHMTALLDGLCQQLRESLISL